MEEREERTFSQLARILREEDSLIENSRIDPVEETLLRWYLESEDDYANSASALGLSQEEARTVLQPFLTRDTLQ